jgi:hypothetical protein
MGQRHRRHVKDRRSNWSALQLFAPENPRRPPRTRSKRKYQDNWTQTSKDDLEHAGENDLVGFGHARLSHSGHRMGQNSIQGPPQRVLATVVILDAQGEPAPVLAVLENGSARSAVSRCLVEWLGHAESIFPGPPTRATVQAGGSWITPQEFVHLNVLGGGDSIPAGGLCVAVHDEPIQVPGFPQVHFVLARTKAAERFGWSDTNLSAIGSDLDGVVGSLLPMNTTTLGPYG